MNNRNSSVKLSELVDNLPTSYGSEVESSEEQAPVVKVSNVGPRGETRFPFELRGFRSNELRTLKSEVGELLVVKSSGSKANVLSGKTAIVTEETKGCVASNFTLRLRPRTDRVSPRFLWYVLNGKKAKDFVNTVVGTTTYPNLKWSTYQNLPISLPALSEQRRIAAILDKADALRAKRREAIAKLDQLLQSVFLEMFGDPVTNPKRWPIGEIRDLLASAKYGTSAKADVVGDVPVLRMNNLTYSGEMDLTALKYVSGAEAEEKYLVHEGDILFNRTNSKELVGKTAVYAGPTPMAFAGYLVRARTTAAHSPEYISAYLNSAVGKAVLRGMCKSIVGMANINAQEMQDISLPVPPTSLQKQFADRVKAIRFQKTKLLKHENLIARTFSALQSQLFEQNA